MHCEVVLISCIFSLQYFSEGRKAEKVALKIKNSNVCLQEINLASRVGLKHNNGFILLVTATCTIL